ncbi:hypothetical protein [Actinoplanes sichuanensis]|uniref:Uncharacterized protein n=1 Tax=Actinoplanes sichuanensis TaxID=512349 RepID=A0ABW4AKJ0_9ACTN|nr:hypothetical protein [Actinoplanes sichuanensis]
MAIKAKILVLLVVMAAVLAALTWVNRQHQREPGSPAGFAAAAGGGQR